MQLPGVSAPRPVSTGAGPAEHASESEKKLAEVQERYGEAILRLGTAEANANAAQRGEIKEGEIKRLDYAMAQLREEHKKQREVLLEKVQKLEKENRKLKDVLSKIST